jgi:oligopeptide/dipeptide ABC transporter ATP-binding protein
MEVGYWSWDRASANKADPGRWLAYQDDGPWAPLWGHWYLQNAWAKQEPRPDHWIRTMWDLWEKVQAEPDEAKGHELFTQIIKMHRDAPVAVGVVGENGGQRQRATIALALVLHPSLLIADEPTTALDVTTEAQILELLLELQRDLGMAMQYITHNLGVISELVDDVVVMYLGKAVEYASVEEIFDHPSHPYTRALLRSIPALGKKSRHAGQRLESIRGMVPDPYRVPAGCAFHPRCPSYQPGVCDSPAYVEVSPNHRVLCSRTTELTLAGVS